MFQRLIICLTAGLLWTGLCVAQTAKPTERVIGTVTAVDQPSHTVSVKEDKTGTEYKIDLANTKTLLRVAPGAKDLKEAARITAADLAVGDRVQVGGSKSPDNASVIVARSVILMSARDLQQLHQEQQAAWQHSTAGVVTAIDAAAHKLEVTARTSQGPKPMSVDAANAAFTRYSPKTPGTPAPSAFGDIQAGDQVRIIGQKNADESAITAERIYSSSFRTVVGTVSSIAPDGSEITIKNLQTKRPMTISLNGNSAVRKLPPMMAYILARRFNPDFHAPAGGAHATPDAGPGNSAGAPPYGAKAGEAHPGTGPGAEGHPAHAAGTGDLSQMLERLPKIATTDLKAGDAVVISGSPESDDNSHLLASTIIAGVEPIFQSASPRQAQSLGDWGASLGGGGSEEGMPGGSQQ